MDLLINKPLISIFANRTDLKEKDIPIIRLLNLPITLTFIYISLYLNRYVNSGCNAHTFLKNDIQAIENQQRVLSDENVLKFYFVKDEALQKLEESYVIDSNRQQL